MGGAGGNAGDGRGGGALSTIGLTVVGRGPATLNVSHSTFTGNQAIGANGGPGKVGGVGSGGAIANLGGHNFNATLSVTHSTITDNRASGGAAGDGGSAGSGIGGGLYLEAGGSVCLDAFTIAHLFGNHASTSDDDVFGNFTICD